MMRKNLIALAAGACLAIAMPLANASKTTGETIDDSTLGASTKAALVADDATCSASKAAVVKVADESACAANRSARKRRFPCLSRERIATTGCHKIGDIEDCLQHENERPDPS